MSFGFLTESALLPSKSKPIRVDGRSLVDLKAVVYAKEQKVKLEGGGSGSGGLRGLRGKRRAAGDGGDRVERKDPFARSNRGVEDRSQRDELERVTASKKRKAAQRVMAAKSSLYEKMAKGEVAGVSRAGSLVDFSRKTGDDLALLEAKAREPKSRRSDKKGDGKSGPDLDTDDDNDDDGDFSGARSKSGKKRQRSGRGSGKRRGGGERSDSGGDDDGVGGRGGYFSDDDGDDGGGYGGFGAEVEIVDEFGRHRTVARGSREHREHLQAKKQAAEVKAEQQQQQQQQSERAAGTAGSASSSFDDRYSYRGNRGAPPPPPPSPPPAGGSSSSSYTASASGGSDRAAAAAPQGDWAWSSGAGRGADAGDFETREGQDRQAKKGMAELLQREGAGGDEGGKGEGGAKILSQWEKTLTGDQKTYLREVQRETEAGRRKATAASGDRKTDREKQKSERKELLRRKQEARATRLRESA